MKPIVWIMAFIPAYGLRAAGDVKFSMAVCTFYVVYRVSLVIFLQEHFIWDRWQYGLECLDWTVRI
ncbi:MAG: hypothetical protein ACLTS6_17555 [Anaerobutyricum sp.]